MPSMFQRLMQWLSASLLIFVFLKGPVYGGIALLFLPYNMMLYRFIAKRNEVWLFSLLITLVSIVLSSIPEGVFVLTSLVSGIWMGESVLKGKSKVDIYIQVAFIWIVGTVISYVSAFVVYGVNWLEKLQTHFYNNESVVIELLQSFNEDDKEIPTLVREGFLFYELSFPTLFIVAAFVTAWLVLTIAFTFGKLLNIPFPKFPKWSTLQFPLLLIFVYGGVLLITLFGSVEVGSDAHVFLLNSSHLLKILFVLQGVSFFRYALEKANASKFITLVVTLIALLLSSITVLIGILDIGMRLRDWVDRKADN